jgi:heptosyltransferase-3
MGLKIAALAGVDPYSEVQVRWLTEDEQAALRIVRETLHDEPFAVLHPTPKFSYKKWHPNGWRELAEWLTKQGLKIVLTGSANREEVDYLVKIFPRLPPGTINVAGKLNFGALAALLKGTSLYIGPDTVVTHVAAALGVPTVALFGPSNPVKWGPWPKGCEADSSPYRFRGTQFVGNVALVQGAGHCVPCLQEGCARHKGSESVCLQMLAVGTVIEAAENLLARTRVPG